MQTCLEKTALSRRPIELNRNDYQKKDPYTSQHPNALSDGDEKGKGTGHGGHGHAVPDCNKATMGDDGHLNSAIDYSNFDTFSGGGKEDIEGRVDIDHSGRNRLMTINNFNKSKEYSSELVNTEKNVLDGQYTGS